MNMIYHYPSPFKLVYPQENASISGFPSQPVVPAASPYPQYITNYAVSPAVCDMFRRYLGTFREQLKELHVQEDAQGLVRMIGMILTQHLHLLVRYQRWIFVYDGRIFRLCPGNQELAVYLRELCERITEFVPEFYCTPSFVRALAAEVSQTCQNIQAFPNLRDLIVFRNGILNLETMQLLPFTPDIFVTSMVDVNWDWSAQYCPVFWQLIMNYACNDQVLAFRMLEAFGTCLTNDCIKTIFCLIGVTNSGKSFIADYIRSLLNQDSVVVMMPDEFGKQFANFKIFNKSLCMCMDMPSTPMNPAAVSAVKQISGGDMIASEVKYQNGNVCFESRTHLMLGSNFDIRPCQEDIAFNARKVILPFCHRIAEEQVSKEVLRAMLEPEKEAIVNLLINAYLNLRARNYVFSGTGGWYDTYVPGNGLKDDCKGSLQRFIAEFCIFTNNSQNYVFTEDLFRAYQLFAAANDTFWIDNTETFSRYFSMEFPYLTKSKKRRMPDENPQSVYQGLCLKQMNIV